MQTSAYNWLRFLAVAGCVAVLFLIANRGAYRGYFQDDDLDNLSFTRAISFTDNFLEPLVVPEYFANNFRPLGHLYYRVMGSVAGLHYPPYVAVIQAIHLLNALLLWLALRKLGLGPMACIAGALFFVFNMAVFDVLWEPMYVFDLLCGTFCLASLLAWLHGRWLLSLAAFWLAFRSKELAIALPAVLLAYEFLLGKRRWKPLVPFFAVSIYMGARALFSNHPEGASPYALHLSAASIWTCLKFYGAKPFLLPAVYGGGAAIVLMLLLLVPNRVARFGIASFWILLSLMLLLPGRLSGAYLYVPLAGLSIAFAALASGRSLALIAVFFAFWLPWNYLQLRENRRAALAAVPDRRAFVGEVQKLARLDPDIQTFVYDSGPVNAYGTRGAILLSRPKDRSINFVKVEDPGFHDALRANALAVIDWNAEGRKLVAMVRRPGTKDTPFIRMGDNTPVWQLEKGWYDGEGAFRWTMPQAAARLARPSGPVHFELTVNTGREYLDAVKRSHVAVSLNGIQIGECDFTRIGFQTVKWPVPPGGPGPAEAIFKASPTFVESDGTPLGIAIVAFGFVPN